MSRIPEILMSTQARQGVRLALLALLGLFAGKAKGQVFADRVPNCQGSWETVLTEHEPPEKDTGNTYLISKPGQLAYVNWALNTDNQTVRNQYVNATFKLTADLDMGAHFWERTGIRQHFGGTLDGNGHTIRNLYCYQESAPTANHCGSMFGMASGATFKDLTMYNCFGEGGKFTSILVGQAQGSVTFENVHLVKCGLCSHGNHYVGGFVGISEQSATNLTFTGCSSDVQVTNVGTDVGGFIGLVNGTNAVVTMDNCVSRTVDNGYFDNPPALVEGWLYNLDGISYWQHGGFVGSTVTSADFKLSRLASYTDSHEGNLMQGKWHAQKYKNFWSQNILDYYTVYKNAGAVIGGWHSNVVPRIESTGIFVDEDASSLGDMWTFAMGLTSDTPRHAGADLRNVILSLKKDDEAFATVAKLNEEGMTLALNDYDGEHYATPLPGDEGKVVAFKQYDDEDYAYTCAYKTDDREDVWITDPLTGRKRAYFSYGKNAYYRAEPHNVKYWVMDDATIHMKNKERTGKAWFKGQPDGSGELAFTVAKKPIVKWRTASYSKMRQHTTLGWIFDQSVDIDLWKKKGAYFRIYRNGELADSVAFDGNTYDWTDKTPKTGGVNKYEVRAVCPSVYFDEEDNYKSLSASISCTGVASPVTSVSSQLPDVTVEVKVPNSVAFDSCKVAVVKHVLAAGESPVLKDSAFKVLEEKTFYCDRSRKDSVLTVKFIDKAGAMPCNRWVYESVCYDFPKSSEAYGTLQWGTAEQILGKNTLSVKTFTSSKGESTDKIKLKWTVQNPDGSNVRYTIHRKLYVRGEYAKSAAEDSTDWESVGTVTTSAKSGSYTDDVLPGYVYKYMLQAHPACDGVYSDDIYTSANTIGFAASRGTIMGRIAYTGNTAVQGVDVRLTPEESSFSQKGGSYSLYFDGDGSVLPVAPGLGESFWKGDWHLSFMLLPVERDTLATLLTLPGSFALALRDDKLYVGGEECLTLPNPRTYNCVILSHDKSAGMLSVGYACDDGKSDTVAWWKGSYADAALAGRLPEDSRAFTDTLVFGGGFEGYLDEVRLWKTKLDNGDVADTYNRYLSGNEAKLAAYYTFDSGVQEYAFDTSHPGGSWNNLHTAIPSPGHPAVTDAVLVPDDILTYRGVTDKNGEYQISGIPFVGEGSNYLVVPVLGTHVFSPATTRRYVSQQSLAHSGVDFTDKSSFVTPVQAYYVYGSMPVEGLGVYVDGVLQQDEEGQEIRTGKDGRTTVSVPIGSHRLCLAASGHTMTNDGYACSVEVVSSAGKCKVTPLSKDKGYLDFLQDRVSALTFYDSTLVRVVGVVAGGKDEAAKPVGFGKCNANMGAYKMQLVPEVTGNVYNGNGKYDEITIAPDTVPYAITSTTTYAKGSVSVVTDSGTGEYVAMLPPVQWRVKSLAANADGDADIDLSGYSRIISPKVDEMRADTLWDEGLTRKDASQTDTYKVFGYAVRQDYIKYNAPVFTLSNLRTAGQDDADSLMLGESFAPVEYWDSQKQESCQDTVRLWRKDVPHDGTANSYTLGHPVFICNDKYGFRIRLMEEYVNHDNKKRTLVPVCDSKIQISNKCASTEAKVLSTGGYELSDTNTQKSDTTKAGVADYEFTAGFPKMTGDFLLPVTITYNVNGKETTQSFYGIVTGNLRDASGQNFVTKGPDKVDFVLFDPPGSNSYAYIEKGSTMMAKNTCNFRTKASNDYKKTTTTGDKHETYEDVEGIVKLMSQGMKKTTTGYDITVAGETGYDWVQSETYTFNERFATSSDPKSVGAKGDLYVGTAHNIVYSPVNSLGFQESAYSASVSAYAVKSEKGYSFSLANYSCVGVSDEMETTFYYTQNEIVTQVIPTLVKARNAFVREANIVDKLPSKDENSKTGKYEYYVLKSSFDKELWVRDDKTGVYDYVSLPPLPQNVARNKAVRDSVQLYNEQIRLWQNEIRRVEQQKLERFANLKREEDVHYAGETDVSLTLGYLGNISYAADGGAVDNSFSVSQSYLAAMPKTETFSYSYVANYSDETTFAEQFVGAYDGVASFRNTGGGETLTQIGADMDSKSVKMGYHLQDNNIDDRFTVDVFLPHEEAKLVSSRRVVLPKPYMFCVRGGQTRSPWEKRQMTIYHTDANGNPVALDAGTVSLDAPYIHFGQRRVVDVPAGGTASVEIELGNSSTGTGTLSYLYPYSVGLLSTDNVGKGLDMKIEGKPLNGYSLTLPPGGTYKRTVTIKQSDPGVLEYDDIPVTLYSAESATDTISVHFKPKAPSVTLKNNGVSVVNTSDKVQRVLLHLDGYNTGYYHFAGVNLQYREKDKDGDWQTQYVLINDSALYRDVKGVMPAMGWRRLEAGQDTLSFDLSRLADGDYEVRAETFTLIGNETLTEHSDVLEVRKDTQAPKVFGVPSPSGSVYTGREEISVTFNEKIDTENLNSANFTASAAINDAPANHATALHFDGNTPASTSSRINILGAKRAVGLWYKPVTGKKSCLLSQTLTDTRGTKVPFKVWYNADATMSFEVYGKTFTSSKRALRDDGQPADDWMYLMLFNDNGTGNDAGKRVMHLYNQYGTSSVTQSDYVSVDTLRDIWFVSDNDAAVPLYVGGSADGDPCHAELEGLVVYGDEADLATVSSEKGSKHTANLRGIEAYWPMDEGYGFVAADKVRSRNLTLTGGQYDNWYVPYENYALSLDGSSQCAVLNTERSGIGKNEDFVVEMLFRTESQKPGRHMTLFSNGYGGEGSKEEPTDLADRLSLALTASGAVELNAAGQTYVMGGGYDDAKWHHLALNVHRDGYAIVSVDTVDISNNKLISGKDIGAFSNSRMTLGALRFREAGAGAYTVSDHFAGCIDEVRVWNVYKTAASVNRNVLLGLSGGEAGLVSYYPFERVDNVANTKKTTPTIEDRVTSAQWHDALPEMLGYAASADSAQVAAAATVRCSAGLKPYEVESPVDLVFTTSKTAPEKVVLQFADNVKSSSIQGCTVNFTAKDVRDLAGNYLSQPVSWTSYVDLRDVCWDSQGTDVSLVHEVGNAEAGETYVRITNKSVAPVNWKISNIPSWLNVSPSSGILAAQGSDYIDVSSLSSNPTGRYSGVLYLTSDEGGVDDKLGVTLAVTAVAPDWNVDSFEGAETMTLMGRLKLNNQWSADEQSLVAAFDSNGYCHGVTSPAYSKDMDMYIVNMSVYGEMPAGNPNLYFKVWDSQSGLTYTHVYLDDALTERTDRLPFIANHIYGSFAQLCTIEPADEVQQTVRVKQGWNWVSNWIDPESDNIEKIFDLNNRKNLVVTDIKRRSGDASDTSFTPAESYHLYGFKDGEVVVSGAIVHPDDVEIELKGASGTKNGVSWAWIGYPEYTNMTLSEAFADFKPQVGDVVKNQSSYAMYNGHSWVGSLTYLTPGEGYLYGYRGAEAVKWHYPYKPGESVAAGKSVSAAASRALAVEAAPRGRFSCDRHAYSGNMTLLGSLLADGQTAAGWQVGAFVDGVCRGWQTADSTGRVYLTVSGDGAGSVTYRALDTATGNVTAVRQRHDYRENAVLGDFDSPCLLVAAAPSHYAVDENLPWNYEDYTFVTVTVLGEDGEPYAHDYELAAYCGGECRGAAAGEAGETCPVAIFGENGETYSFKLWDKTTLEELELVGTKAYDAATPNQTLTLRLPGASGIDGVKADDDAAAHRWYDDKGIFHGRKPHESGVYVKDGQKVLHRAK